ncbi:chitin disaccharide deacetylase [Vibrio tapetis subsp. quintayensis]|uniref:chitin disaccharide deacetylase n=1 Tax=Vibrio tapetis TaxID=52443 RepID=UPI0025B44C29|nr:chitin disaccharide deacetylase [Vibrio tapetis]MDN3682982.1 chitin disaccharide deacetylase [Vibrio tapetis subsp. quintayensis]
MKVIFNADDFGLTEGVNTGIVDAFHQGVVRSTTMMVAMPAEKHAVQLAADLPELKVGLHLRFTTGKPLTHHKSLTNWTGNFPTIPHFWQKRDFAPVEVYEEVVAQVERFLSLGLPLSHIDSHHHAHTHPQITNIVSEVAQQYQVPLRGVGLEGSKQVNNQYLFTDQFYDDKISIEHAKKLMIRYESRCEVLEVMCHPAYVDGQLSLMSSYLDQREEELRTLSSPDFRVFLQQRGIQVTDYSVLAST